MTGLDYLILAVLAFLIFILIDSNDGSIKILLALKQRSLVGAKDKEPISQAINDEFGDL